MLAVVLGLAAIVGGYRVFTGRTLGGGAPLPSGAEEEEAHPSCLYGRIQTIDGVSYEGRLRWGGGQEAFWGDYFNGAKKENPWVALVPAGRLPKERGGFEIFGLQIGEREKTADLGRLFMTRFGDIARIEADGRDVRVTLKSGTAIALQRSEASDFDDGVRVWDRARGMADLDSLRIRVIELLAAPKGGAAPDRLYGTVRTADGSFTGFLQWNREASQGSDELRDGEKKLRFDAIRSIARGAGEGCVVTMLDGSKVTLEGGRAERGIYVDDARYGRVLVSWKAFGSLDFSAGGSGPGYDDFPAGKALAGTVTTQAGQQLTGRLVFDLDESETTDTLDAPWKGVDYTLPFGLVGSVVLAGNERAAVTLQSGEKLELELAGDLGGRNAGMLVFVGGGQKAEYVAWGEVREIAFAGAGRGR